MYATFTPSGMYAIELSDNSNVDEDFFDVRDTSGKEIQVLKFFRAVASSTFDRGNRDTNITAKITKCFTTADMGLDWLQAMRAALSCLGLTPPNGTVLLYVRNMDGSTKSFTVPTANITLTLEQQIGNAFMFQYHIQGGATVETP